jgi:biotin carboxylase
MSRVMLLLPTTTWRAEAFLAAARRLGLEVTVATDRALVWTAREPARVIALDFARPEAAAGAVAAFARRWPVGAVVGVDDDTAVLAAAIAARLGLAHTPLAAVEAARDKRRQRELLHQAGLPVPRFTVCRLDEDPAVAGARVGFPCVLKPLGLAASRGVMRADDAPALGAAMRRLAALLASPGVGACGEAAETALAEAFVPGREVALEGLVEDGVLRVLALFDKPDPLDGPFFEESIYLTPSRLPADTQTAVADCAARAARALGLTRGPVHAELRVGEQGPWVIELAARPIGGLCSRVLRFGDGVSLEEIILRQAVGMATAGFAREARGAGVMMVPIPGAGVLERVEGADEAARVPGIEEVVITAHPGERLVPFPEGSRYPGFLFARGESPEAVERALREAHRRLRFVLAPAPADAPRAGTQASPR